MVGDSWAGVDRYFNGLLAGYGFPVERGGPMFYGQLLGAQHLLERLEHYAEKHGNKYGYWTPAEGLKK